MAIYDAGTASLAANGTVTGAGTTWMAPLTLIRVGATIVFKTEPVKIYTISEIVSDTQINVYNPNSETVPAGTGYAILAHDGITVQGLAQDVAETLRYYQSQESYVAQAVDAFNNFDANKFDTKVSQVNTQHGDVVTIGAQVSSDASQVTADKNAAAASAASASADKDAAATSAQEAADYAASLDTQNLLRKDLNFSDVADKAAARANLDVYSKSEIDRSSTYNLWDFHPEPNGGNTDSRPYIQAAIDYIASVGGGTLLIPKSADRFVVSSYGGSSISGHSGIIQLKSNVNIKIEGKIEIGYFFNEKPFQLFVGFDNANPQDSSDLRDVRIYGGGVIDFAGYYFGEASQLRSGITLGRSYNCHVEDIKFQNGDLTWAVTAGWAGYGSNCSVSGCTFENLVVSDINMDHSTVFIICPFSSVRACKFIMQSNRAKVIACAVELHQNNTSFTDCSVYGYARVCYVVILGGEHLGAGNFLYNCIVSGITADIYGQFVTFGAGTNAIATTAINGVTVSNNRVTSPNASGSCSFIDFLQANDLDDTSNFNISDILVVGNSFIANPERELSYAVALNGRFSRMKFSDNVFDVNVAIKSELGSANRITIDGLLWDESNTILSSNAKRTLKNIFDFNNVSSISNSEIHCNVVGGNETQFSMIYFREYTTFSRVDARVTPTTWKTSTGTAVVVEGSPVIPSGLFVSYPKLINFTINAGANAQRVTGGSSYSWVARADVISTPGVGVSGKFDAPSSYCGSNNGQLTGLGWQLDGAQHSFDCVVMLNSYRT